MEQNFKSYTESDKEVWKILFDRQSKNLIQKGSQSYLDSLQKMYPVLHGQDLPEFTKLDAWFKISTGWRIHVVQGLIPVEEFFQLLAEKRFPSSTWLRSKDSMDYLEEPDMFHDIFGHIPLLSNPVYSDFMVEFGKLGCRFIDSPESLVHLQRMYWFCIEFGLISEEKIKAFGAGILSSYGETNQAWEGRAKFKDFDAEEILNHAFRSDEMQTEYYILDSIDQMTEALSITKLFLENKYCVYV